MVFDALKKFALFLEQYLDTEWAEENADLYDDFANRLEAEYQAGRITGKQFNELVNIAFYDWTDDLKEE